MDLGSKVSIAEGNKIQILGKIKDTIEYAVKNQIDMVFSSEQYATRLADIVLNVDIYDNPLELEYYNQLYVYSSFLKHPNGMKAFVDRNDTESFMMYLYLMKKYSNKE